MGRSVDTSTSSPASRHSVFTSLSWPRRLALLCAVVGLAVALYLTAVHLSSGSVPLYCSESGIINCAQVTTSPESVLFGVPVAYYGVLWFAVMLLLQLWNGGAPAQTARLLWVVGGVASVFYLLYNELFIIGAICLWCSVVHLLVLTIFGLTVLFPGAAAPTGDDGPA